MVFNAKFTENAKTVVNKQNQQCETPQLYEKKYQPDFLELCPDLGGVLEKILEFSYSIYDYNTYIKKKKQKHQSTDQQKEATLTYTNKHNTTRMHKIPSAIYIFLSVCLLFKFICNSILPINIAIIILLLLIALIIFLYFCHFFEIIIIAIISHIRFDVHYNPQTQRLPNFKWKIIYLVFILIRI